MICTDCGGRLYVSWGADTEYGLGYQRYRHCPKCKKRFVTVELFKEDVKRLKDDSFELNAIKMRNSKEYRYSEFREIGNYVKDAMEAIQRLDERVEQSIVGVYQED